MLKPNGCLRCRKRVSVGEGGIHMVWWKFKSCPQCDGVMFIDGALYGWYKQCIQCGYACDLIEIVEL
jgi:hypothetical protein